MTNCCIFGLGYIGLPTAAILANYGHRVIGVDVNEVIIQNIQEGNLHIVEKGLDDLVKAAIKKGNLKVSKNPIKSEVFIIAVPTPFIENTKEEIKKPNLEYVFSAAKSISQLIEKDNLVILESTSPVGTCEKVAEIISKESGLEINNINIAYCPERVLPGDIINELINNDRVIGGNSKKSSNLANQLYKSFCKGKIHITDTKTAELVKLTENSFRDVNLAFANELSILCDEYKVNSKELISIANYHPRVNILTPGCGVGGHCIAVDPWFLISDKPGNTSLIKQARKINDLKPLWVLNKIENKIIELEKTLKKEINIGCLGLTFKANVDDIRESPAFFITQKLKELKYKIIACDPNIKSNKILKIESLKSTIKKSDLIVIFVSHNEFKEIDFNGKPFLDFSGFY